jgi:hypothetical protein
METIWKDVVGFEGYYEVSNTGLVRRKKTHTIYKDGRVAFFSETILKQGLNHKGYSRVFLSKESNKSTRTVHRLVAEAFIPNPEKKATVNHKDLNKQNNSVDNLEWLTNKENMQHAFKNGVYNERNKTTILNIHHMREKIKK